jgi:multidrug efflux pump subunit AcrB
MQILVLIVQNSFPASMVGTATASNNYFRQIGASVGASIVGSLFAARLVYLLANQIAGEVAGGSNSITPELVRGLPQPLHHMIVGAYNDALTPIFLFLIPIVVIAVILLCFVVEKPLATTIEQDLLPVSLGGNGEDDVPLAAASPSGDVRTSLDSQAASKLPRRRNTP